MARLILVHGFTQTAASWDAIEYRLNALGHDVVALDAPGHGAHHDDAPRAVEGADLLAAEGGAAPGSATRWAAVLALHVALAHPELVERLVLVGATPGIETAAERIERQAADDLLAEELERDGLDAFLARWLAQPLFATLPEDSAGLDARRANTVAGLAASLRLDGDRSAGAAVGPPAARSRRRRCSWPARSTTKFTAHRASHGRGDARRARGRR